MTPFGITEHLQWRNNAIFCVLIMHFYPGMVGYDPSRSGVEMEAANGGATSPSLSLLIQNWLIQDAKQQCRIANCADTCERAPRESVDRLDTSSLHITSHRTRKARRIFISSPPPPPPRGATAPRMRRSRRTNLAAAIIVTWPTNRKYNGARR